MAIRLDWYDDQTATWITLDHTKYDTLDPDEKYRIFEFDRFNIPFKGGVWDKSIFDSEEDLSYWMGYHGGKYSEHLDSDYYYQGRMDAKNNNDKEADSLNK